MKQCFDQLDTSGDGKLGIDEFRAMAKQVNSSLSEFDVLVLFSEIASIGFSDFDATVSKARIRSALDKGPHVGLWTQIAVEVEKSGKSVKECFDLMDTNQDGKLSQAELWAMMTKINTAMTVDDFRCAFALVDTSSDGSITLSQFQIAVDTAKAKPNSTADPIIMKIKRHVYNARGGPPPYRGSYLTATDFIELDAKQSLQDQKNKIFPLSGYGAGLSSGEIASFPVGTEPPRRWEFPSPGGEMLESQLGKTAGDIFTDKAVVVLIPLLGFD